MIDNQVEINEVQRMIMEATVVCLEKHGIEKVTIRKIAEEAGTNIASINYYFRSKERLIEATLKMTINHMLEDVIVAINNEDLTIQQRLEEVFFYLIEGAMRFPKLTTAQLYDAVIRNDYESPGAVGMRNMFEHLVSKIEDELIDLETGNIRFLLAQILYAFIFLILAPDFVDYPKEYDPSNRGNQRKIASEYARMFFSALK